MRLESIDKQRELSFVGMKIDKTSGSTRIFLWGASRGQNAILRGQKSKKLPKMADFGNFFF